MGLIRRWATAGSAAAAVAILSTDARAAGPRVASINLCTDQLVLTLADPDQIAGLSPWSRDRQRSWAAAMAVAFPALSGAAEDVIALKPDLVLAGRYTKRETRDLLKRHDVRVVEFAPARSIEDAKAQLRQAASLLGHPDRAEGEILRMEAALARARSGLDGRSLSVLALMRRGWVSGRETLLGSLLNALHLRNAGDDLAPPAGGFVPLEAIVAARPDRLLVADEDRPADDQGSALLHHSALRDLYPPRLRIVVPERLTACGGPMVSEALDVLSRSAVDRRAD